MADDTGAGGTATDQPPMRRSIIAEQMQRRRGRQRSLLNPNRTRRRHRTTSATVPPPAGPPPQDALRRSPRTAPPPRPEPSSPHPREQGSRPQQHRPRPSPARSTASGHSRASRHRGASLNVGASASPRASPRDGTQDSPAGSGGGTPKRVSFSFSLAPNGEANGGSRPRASSTSAAIRPRDDAHAAGASTPNGRERSQSVPHSPGGGSVMSAATMSEVEMQARLDQVRHASMRQFQSMKDVHGRDLERVRRELEARHRAAMEAKDRELVEYKKFYEGKVAEEVARVEQSWRQRMEAATAAHEAAVADLNRSLQAEWDAHAKSREVWEKEKRRLMEEAETGFVSLYTDITSNAEALVSAMRKQMHEVVERASRDTRAAHERSLQEVQQATSSRIDFEQKMAKECEVLIKEYQALADRAMRKAAEAREAAQVEVLNKVREQQEDRRRWEAALQRRTEEAVAVANKRAEDAHRALEAERQRFVLLEAEVRRQFEAHCVEFERRMRNKAAVTLTQYKVHLEKERRMALALSTAGHAASANSGADAAAGGGGGGGGGSAGASPPASGSDRRGGGDRGSDADSSPASQRHGRRRASTSSSVTGGAFGGSFNGDGSGGGLDDDAGSSPAPLTDAMKAFQRAQAAVREASTHYSATGGGNRRNESGEFVSSVSEPTAGDAASMTSSVAASFAAAVARVDGLAVPGGGSGGSGNQHRANGRRRASSRDDGSAGAGAGEDSRPSSATSGGELGAAPKEQPATFTLGSSSRSGAFSATPSPVSSPLPSSPAQVASSAAPVTVASPKRTTPSTARVVESAPAASASASPSVSSQGPRVAAVTSVTTALSPARTPVVPARAPPSPSSDGGDLDVTTSSGLNAYIERLRATQASLSAAAALASARATSAMTERALANDALSPRRSPQGSTGRGGVDLMKQYQQAYAQVKRQASHHSVGSAASTSTSNGRGSPRFDGRGAVQAVSPAVAPSPPPANQHRQQHHHSNHSAASSAHAHRGVPHRPPPLPPTSHGSAAGSPPAPPLPSQDGSAPTHGHEDEEDALAAVVGMMSEQDREAWEMLQSMY